MRKKTIKLARYKDDTIIHVDEADNGLSCECTCLLCNERLQAVHPKFKQTHFRHNQNLDCTGGPETALHLFAKQIILENHEINLPGKHLGYNNPRAEICLGRITPDVQVEVNGVPVYFEIAVTHKIGLEKRNYYCLSELKSVEIDLTGISYDFKKHEIEKLVLKTNSNKDIIFWEKIIINKPSDDSGHKSLFILIGVAAAVFFITEAYT